MSAPSSVPAALRDARQRAGEPAPQGGLFSAPALAMAAVLALALAGVFWEWLLRQNRFSMEKPADWGHVYMVPFISGYFIYKRRAAIARLAPSVFWPGMLPLLIGIAAYYMWTLMPIPGIHMFQGYALVLCVAGLTLLLTGPRLFALLCLPVAYLGFAVTVGDALMQRITFQLQLIASQGAALLLKMMGFTVDLAGNTLSLASGTGEPHMLNVAEACSGMRMVIAFLALGVAVAFLSCPQWWQRVALVLLAVPVAVLTNVIRVASLGLASIWSPGLAEGTAHELIGVLWLVPAFLFFMGIVWALKGIVRDESKPAALAKRVREAAIG